jgi:hypothetical protein
LLTIDGVTLVDGNRVLDKDNSTAANRGIWIAHSGAWIRAVDADSDADVTSGLFVFVEEGTVNADKGFILTTHNPITLGSTGLTFSQFNVNPGGTVTSIAATVPSWLSISGSPITSSGTLAITAASGQTANRVLATPDSSTGAVTLRQIVSGDISGPLTVAVGGTNASTARAVGANVGIYQLSAGGGGSGEGDYSGKTPAFEGQLGVAYYGGKAPFFYFSGSTTTSDWKHEFNFPTGVKQVGSVGTMADVDGTHGMYRLDFHFNGSTIGYQTQSDDGIWVRTWSIHTNNSGASIGHVVTGGDDGSGKATIIDLVGSSFTYVPANRIASVIPGNSLLIFNSDSTNLKGLAIASTNCTGAFGGGAAGNYSLAYFDFKNGLFRVPRFVASKFQPDDSGWLDSFTVNPSTGAVAVGASGSFTTGASTSITMQPVASTGISISSAGNVTVCANNANTGTSSWSRVIVNTDAAAASPGVTVGINGGGHGVYCSTDGLTIGITNCGSSAAKWYDGGAGANTSKGNYSHTPTWNSSGTTFTGHLFNVTNTASAAGSLIFDWQIGGTSVLKLSKASVLTMTGSLTVTAAITGAIFIGSTATISASDIDWTVAEYRYKTLGANTTLTFSNVTEGETIYVGITNTASNWTLTWPAMSWVGGITPVQTIGAKTDWYAIWRVNGITWGSYLQGY